jgi:hypothetical protein
VILDYHGREIRRRRAIGFTPASDEWITPPIEGAAEALSADLDAIAAPIEDPEPEEEGTETCLQPMK